MRQRRYEAYIFDLYGTLVNIRTNESKRSLWKKCSGLYASLRAHYGAEELRERYLALTAREAARVQKEGERKYGSDFLGEADLTAVFQELFLEKGVACSRERAAMTAYFFRMLSMEKLYVYPGVEKTLAALQKAGGKIYLLSNAQSDYTRPELEMLGLTAYFDGILISSEEGCRKPSPVFYRRLVQRYGLEPSACLMTGNDPEADILGAKALGMDTLYVHTEISPPLSETLQATYTALHGGWKEAAGILLQTARL